MSKLFVSQHPLVKHKLTMLRSIETGHRDFRGLVRELALLLCYEATQDIPLTPYTVQTPLAETSGFKAPEIGIVPILRAGLGMVEGVLELLPNTQVWHIGLYRDEKTLRPVEYYNKLPSAPTIEMCLVLDPMLATGGSATATIDILKRWGVKRIKYMGLIAAPEGVKRLSEAHPDVPIHVATVDSHLNEVGFIVPGLGDAGDRQFGT
ncbi:MAG: uracil phosphoribosyltransferase [Anaerolineae bacterium]|jgi:uracil phosphoribosyltransferase|nr:uracil phosphoribosyltransferase [Anaerolineae bacterium]